MKCTLCDYEFEHVGYFTYDGVFCGEQCYKIWELINEQCNKT